MAERITLTKEKITSLIRENPSSTYDELLEALMKEYPEKIYVTNQFRAVGGTPITSSSLPNFINFIKTSGAKDNKFKKLYENKIVDALKGRSIDKFDPRSMEDIGRYFEDLVRKDGVVGVGGKFKSPVDGKNVSFKRIDNVLKEASKKDPITFPYDQRKTFSGEKIYKAIRAYGKGIMEKEQFQNAKGQALDWAKREGKGLVGVDQFYRSLKPVDQNGFTYGTIKQFLTNAPKKPSGTLTQKNIETANQFLKTIEEAGVKFIPKQGKNNSPHLFDINNADPEKLSQIGKLAPSIANNLRKQIVRYSKASNDFKKFGGARDFKLLRDTTDSLRKTLTDTFGNRISASPELVKSELLSFLNDNPTLKNQISAGFDSGTRKFFKRDLNTLDAERLLADMMPDIDHAKSIKQIGANYVKGDAAMAETMFNKTLTSNYFNKSLKNKVVNAMVDTDYDESFLSEVRKNLKDTGGILKTKGTEFVADPLNPIISKQAERLGYEKFLDPKLEPELKAQSDFYKGIYKDIQKLPYENKRLVETAVGCTITRADGGRINMVEGGTPSRCVEIKLNKDPEGFMKKVASIEETSGPINKIKNAASTFLNVAKKGGRFGAFAAVGAAGAGLVKQFRNDDPSTYLSSENQQKNMLIDMLEQPIVTPTETPSTALGDATLPAIGAVTAAGMIPGGAELYRQRTGAGNRKRPLGGDRLDAEGVKIPKKRVSPFRAATGPLSGVLGKGLAATGTPLGMLALEPLYIGQQIAEGDSLGEIATNPLNYLGPAFAGSLSKEATRFAGPKMANLMRLGISPTALKTVSRRFGLPGLALSAGISGYEMYQNKKAGRGLFDDG